MSTVKNEKDNLNAEGRLNSVAIIMDGNGRWAKKRLLPRTVGHKYGASIIEKILAEFRRINVHYVTLYAFSTENWKRPKEEVDVIMDLVYKYIDEVVIDKLIKEKNFSIRFIGDKSALSEKLREKCEEAERLSTNKDFVCNVALNYGGRDEIVYAASRLAEENLPITVENMASHMYTAGTPDPDLVIRTGGDHRISNFLLWQSAYSEYIILDTLWPDFSEDDIAKCVKEFYSRKRRFGGLDKEE